ncbi:MAG: hypothetical protein B6244_13960 [Candidatus Cloacimonetes bacterium 4572_55]|nr:MAG: hypothetical protein B6244_13960 [Candidatus Cloacimonetes bacterium 4572_55]
MKNKRSFYLTLNRLRVLSQITTILFLIAVPLLNIVGVHWILGTLYSISFGKLDIADPAIVAQTILLTWNLYIPLLIAALIPILIAFICGRVFCSWICPHNTISEWITAFQKRFMTKRWRQYQKKSKNVGIRVYFGILATLLLVTALFKTPLVSYLSPPGVISSQISQLIRGSGIGLELAIVLLIFIAEFFLFQRYWCKLLCPVGAMLGAFHWKGKLRVQFQAAECKCGKRPSPCQMACPLQLEPKKKNLYPACFNCGLCAKACENTGHKAIQLTF